MNSISDINNNEIVTCPHCKDNNICKYGYVKKRQRYRCKNCGRTFTSYTNKPWSNSRISIEVWDKYLSLMDNKNTLLECSRILGINIKTAFRMRHKIMNIIQENNGLLQGVVGIVRRVYYENRKGSKNIEGPRRKYNLHFGVDSQENSFLDINDDIMSVNLVADIIKCKINNDAVILPSNNRFVNKAIGPRIKSGGTIEYLNVCREYSFYKIWNYEFRGVATKYIYSYYSWYRNKGKVRRRVYDIVHS